MISEMLILVFKATESQFICLETDRFYELHLVPKRACKICDFRFHVRKYLGTGATSLFGVDFKGFYNTI